MLLALQLSCEGSLAVTSSPYPQSPLVEEVTRRMSSQHPLAAADVGKPTVIVGASC